MHEDSVGIEAVRWEWGFYDLEIYMRIRLGLLQVYFGEGRTEEG